MSTKYTIPTFNLNVNIWRVGNDVQANAPDVTSVGCLVNGRSGGFPIPAINFGTAASMLTEATKLGQFMSLLLPKLTDVRGTQGGAGNLGDAVEVPAGSGRFYLAQWVDDVGKGFQNEHREAMLIQNTLNWQVVWANPWNMPAWPYPTP